MKRYGQYFSLIGAVLVLTCFAAPLWAAQPHMYRCKDADGRVYYTDRPGVNCAGQEADEMTKHGLVLDKDKAARANESPEERRRRLAQERSDRALMQTYTSEDQIEAAKQNSLKMPLLGVKYAKKKLAIYNERLVELRDREEQMTNTGERVPLSLIESIDATLSDIARVETDLEIKQRTVDRIVERYEAEKQRYRELTEDSDK